MAWFLLRYFRFAARVECLAMMKRHGAVQTRRYANKANTLSQAMCDNNNDGALCFLCARPLVGRDSVGRDCWLERRRCVRCMPHRIVILWDIPETRSLSPSLLATQVFASKLIIALFIVIRRLPGDSRVLFAAASSEHQHQQLSEKDNNIVWHNQQNDCCWCIQTFCLAHCVQSQCRSVLEKKFNLIPRRRLLFCCLFVHAQQLTWRNNATIERGLLFGAAAGTISATSSYRKFQDSLCNTCNNLKRTLSRT